MIKKNEFLGEVKTCSSSISSEIQNVFHFFKMASEQDLEQMKSRLKELEDKKTKLEDLVENETQKNNILLLLNSEYEKMREDFLEEEQKNLNEIGDLSLEVKKLRKLVPEKPQKIFDLHDQNLEQGENDLMAEIELMERATFQLDQAKQNLEKLQKQEKIITPELDQTETFVFTYENVAKSLSRPGKFIMSIQDLEVRLEQMKQKKPLLQEQIRAKEEEKSNLSIDNSFKTSELRRMHAAVDGKNADTAINDATVASLLNELSKCTIELQQVNTRFEVHRFDRVKPIEEEIDKTKQEIEAIKKKIQTIQHEKEHFPQIIKETKTDDQRKIQKKIQLANEIERKINDIRNEILRSISSSDTVMSLNSVMEEEWKEEHKMEDEANALEKQLLRLQDDLERKKYMRIEIENIQNNHVPKKDSGMHALELLYNFASAENKRLAEQFDKIQKEFIKATNELEKAKKSHH